MLVLLLLQVEIVLGYLDFPNLSVQSVKYCYLYSIKDLPLVLSVDHLVKDWISVFVYVL
jgi:hypothetical protein